MRALAASALIGTVAAFLASGALAGSQATLRPTLAISGSSPVTITGQRFRPLERVTVRLSVPGETLARTVIANRSGRLVARFTAVAAQAQCGGFVTIARAIGARGSIAAVRRLEIPPPCGIAPQP